MRQFCYRVDPIDFGWEFLRTVEETIEICLKTRMTDLPTDSVEEFIEQLRKDCQKAQRLALRRGWEGDFVFEPRVIWLPDDGAFIYGFAWKQMNNGATFVITPRPMNRLKPLSY